MAGLWTTDGFHCQITNDAALEIAENLKKGITRWGPFEVEIVKPDSSRTEIKINNRQRLKRKIKGNR